MYFWNKTLHVSGSSLPIIRSFSPYTLQWYMSYRFADSLRAGSGRNVWHIPLLCVRWKTPDDGQRNCLKHVEFYSKNKFEKLVHLVGFIIRIYHDAWSHECQSSWQEQKILPDRQLRLIGHGIHTTVQW